MAQQSIEILRNYMTCEDPTVKNKYFNLLDSFWHKSEGQLLKEINEDSQGIAFTFTNGMQVTVPKLPGSVGISFVDGLQAALDNKVDKQLGKGLSTNDFTNALLQKLNGLENYTLPDSFPISQISGLQAVLDDKVAQEPGKGLSQNDLTDELVAKINKSAAQTIIIGQRTFTYRPIVGNDGSSFQAGDIATNGWVDQNTFGKLLSYTGSGAGTGEDFDDWQIIESI